MGQQLGPVAPEAIFPADCGTLGCETCVGPPEVAWGAWISACTSQVVPSTRLNDVG
jgi:hypothetical protein